MAGSSLRLKEELVGVGTMDRRVAEGACLVFLSQIVERGSSGRTGIHGEGMALQTEQVDLGSL